MWVGVGLEGFVELVFKLTCERQPLGNQGCDLASVRVSGKCIGRSGGGVSTGLEDEFSYLQNWSDLKQGFPITRGLGKYRGVADRTI